MSDLTSKPDGVSKVVPKKYNPIPAGEIELLLQAIQGLMCDGFYFRKVKSLLGVKP
jgi:hypothetical protein